MPIRVFKYGLLDPDPTGAALVDDQIYKAHRYYNTLVEIERERRQKVRAVLGAHSDVAPLEEALAAALVERDASNEALAAARKAARARKVDPTLTARVKAASTALREIAAKVREAKSAIANDPQITAALAEIDEAATVRCKTARAACGVYWGTYLLVEQAIDMARKSKTDPQFRRWDHGEVALKPIPPDTEPRIVDMGDAGRVSVQIQNGISVEQLCHGEDTRVRVDPVSELAWLPETRRGDRRRLARTRLHLRVGSNGRAPIWASWPMIMHRPLPKGARIKTVTVSRHRRGIRRWEWSVQIVCDLPDTWAGASTGQGACALNLGWCTRPDGLRVGYVVGTDAHEQEIVMPQSISDRLEKAESIRGFRDRDLNVMRPKLLEALAALSEQPEWLRVRCEHLALWLSPIRFTRLAFAWRAQRFEGDAEAFELLEAWRYRDEHLHRYETGLVRGALGHRRELYRIAARRLADRYHTLVVDDADLRALARKPKAESAEGENTTAKYNKQTAGASILREALINAFSRAGRVVRLSSVEVTMRCSACNAINEWDRTSGERERRCSGCGVIWDQDANACRNLLREHATQAIVEPKAKLGPRFHRKASESQPEPTQGLEA